MPGTRTVLRRRASPRSDRSAEGRIVREDKPPSPCYGEAVPSESPPSFAADSVAEPWAPSEDDLARSFDRLWPLMRSITGDGVRRTLDILSEIVPLTRIEVPSGTRAFDWTVPKEWVFRDAYVVGPDGRRAIDAREHTLHLVNYSIPFRGRLSRAELDRHLHSLPELPDAIPYATSYYEPQWGFCLAHRRRQALPDGDYEVVVDTEHVDGSLTIGEAVLPGESDDEVLISTYVCHPSMANNELSGPLAVACLGRRLLARTRRRFTYRLVFLPETIGSICYLSRVGEHLKRHLKAGVVVTCVGDSGRFHYKPSRRGGSVGDRAADLVLRRQSLAPYRLLPYRPVSDERQYCSPHFDLPVGSFLRAIPGEFREYHTSLDDRRHISFGALRDSIEVLGRYCETLDANRTYRALTPCEPHLSKRGLYPDRGGARAMSEFVDAISWLHNYADGRHDLLAIAELSGLDLGLLHRVAEASRRSGTIEAVD
jgi:aminopeptidase-like protein